MLVARPFSCPAMRRNVLTTARSAVAYPDQLTTSAPVVDRYCFTLNFGHATGASLHSHNVPQTVVPTCQARQRRSYGAGYQELPHRYQGEVQNHRWCGIQQLQSALG